MSCASPPPPISAPTVRHRAADWLNQHWAGATSQKAGHSTGGKSRAGRLGAAATTAAKVSCLLPPQKQSQRHGVVPPPTLTVGTGSWWHRASSSGSSSTKSPYPTLPSQAGSCCCTVEVVPAHCQSEQAEGYPMPHCWHRKIGGGGGGHVSSHAFLMGCQWHHPPNGNAHTPSAPQTHTLPDTHTPGTGGSCCQEEASRGWAGAAGQE